VGLGLGLHISRDIIRSFRGELLAENRAEGGARFIVSLPEQTDSGTPSLPTAWVGGLPSLRPTEPATGPTDPLPPS